MTSWNYSCAYLSFESFFYPMMKRIQTAPRCAYLSFERLFYRKTELPFIKSSRCAYLSFECLFYLTAFRLPPFERCAYLSFESFFYQVLCYCFYFQVFQTKIGFKKCPVFIIVCPEFFIFGILVEYPLAVFVVYEF